MTANSFSMTEKLDHDFFETYKTRSKFPEKSYSVFHPIDDENFTQTDFLFLTQSGNFNGADISVFLADMDMLVNQSFAKGFYPSCVVLGFNAFIPESDELRSNWKSGLSGMAAGLDALGLPATVGFVQGNDDGNAYFSILLIARRQKAYEPVTNKHTVFCAFPECNFFKSNKHLIDSAANQMMFELTQFSLVRMAQKVSKNADVLFADAILLTNKGLSINRDQLIPDNYFILPEKSDDKAINQIVNRWGFTLVEVGQLLFDKKLIVNNLAGNPLEMTFTKEENAVKNDNLLINNDLCVCENETWLPDFPDDPDSLRDVATRLLCSPITINDRLLRHFFDHTADYAFPSISQKTSVLFHYFKHKNDWLCLRYLWLQNRNKLTSCRLREKLALACCEMACTGVKPQSVVAVFPDALDLHRCACLASFCHLFELQLNTQISENESTASGVSLSVLGKTTANQRIIDFGFRQKGDLIFLIGRSHENLSGSLYQKFISDEQTGELPPADIVFEKQLIDILLGLHQQNMIESACSVGRGGLFNNLVDCAIAGMLGFDITTDAEIRNDAFLFSETPGRVVVSVSPQHETRFIDFLMLQKMPFSILGHVTKDELRVDDLSYGFVSDIKQCRFGFM
jgi:hypothetical protein